MNTYTLHITLYDVAFVGMIFIGLNFTLLLWFTKSVNRGANRILALAVVTMALWMMRILAIDIRLETYLPGWDRLPMQFLLALGPLIFFYVLKITRPEYKPGWKDLLHFTPLLLEQGSLALEISESIKTGTTTYNTPVFQQLNPLLQLFTFISIITYLYRSHKLINNFYRRLQPVLMDRSLLEFRWLRRLIVATALLWVLWIAYAAVDYFGYRNQLGTHLYYPFYIFFAVITISTAAAAFLKPQAGTLIQPSPSFKPSVPEELRGKGAWIKRQMETNRYHRDQELSLSSLAEKLDIHPHELSRIVNIALKKNFNDFINEYRVRDVASKMQDPAYDRITLLGMAYDAGFNSKTTFARAFKQLTGKNPATYKHELEKEGPTYHLNPRAQNGPVILVPEVPQWSHERLNYNYMFRNYLKVAFRNFRRHKLFTLINVIGLSIGISAAVVIYLVARYDLTFDRFYPDNDRIYRVVNGSSDQNGKSFIGGVDGPIPEAVKNEVTGLSQSVPFYTIDEWALNRTGVIIPAISGAPLKFKYSGDMILADQRYFDMFPYKWLAGSKSSLNKPFTVVLTSQRAAKYFPGLPYDQMIGKTVIYGDTVKATVTGVVEEHQKNTDFNFNDFLSYSTANHVEVLKGNLALQNWGSITPSSQFFVKLANNSSVANIERQLAGLLKKHLPPSPSGEKNTRALKLEKLSDLHFDEQYSSWGARTASKATLYGLLAIAAFLLLLGCINFINLTTAQSVQRAKEIGIRKTMGSSRRELIVQFLSETFLLTLFAIIISCALTPVILKLFADFIPPGVKVNFIHQPDLLLFLLLLTITVSLLSGFYPATILSAFKPVQVLKNQSKNHTGETRNAFLRKTLTVTQFAIAQFFIIATIMVSKQVYYALHKDLGFKKEAILSITTPWNRDRSLMQVYINRVNALPQVEMVSVGGASPSSDNTHSTTMTYMEGKKVVRIDGQERFGDENYIRVYGIKLLAGRDIQPGDSGKAFLVNVSFAHAMGFKNPADAVNNFVQYAGKKMQVAGVIGDFYYRSLHSPIQPLVVVERNDNTYFSSTLHIALKPQSAGGDDWQRAIAGMQTSFKKLYPDNDFQYQFFDDAVAQFYTTEQHTSTLLGWATGLSILISCLGLLGLAIYTTNQRTKEIGVRKVLGATVSQIVLLLSTEMAWLIVLAFVIISPVAWWAMNKWMQDFADRTAISWWIFALSGGGMLLTALFTSGFQTIKAALANPVKSLRSE